MEKGEDMDKENKKEPRTEEKDQGRKIEISYISERKPEKPDWIEEQNKWIMEIIWIIFISMVTAIITVVLATK